VPTELRHQLPRLPHRLPLQVRLRRRRPHRRLAAAPAASHGRPSPLPPLTCRDSSCVRGCLILAECSAAEAARLVLARFRRAGPLVSESSAGNLGHGARG
jgi:hypothetical protein